MATIVCQGLQSCLESQLVEPRTLRLRLSSLRVVPHFSEPLEKLTFKSCFLDSNSKPLEEKCHSDQENPQNVTDSPPDNHKHKSSSSNADPGSWSFLEAITNGCQLETTKADKHQNEYVHPLSKRSSSSTLSDKSLELCTENLGSETGTDIIEESIFSSSDSESGNFPTREQKKSRKLLGAKKASNCRSFPPPLTTISGLDSLQVRPHREDGRLIIKAVKAPSKHSLFQAERSHGRLRLSIFKDSLSPFGSHEEPEEEEEEEKEVEEMATDIETTLDDDSTHKEFKKEEEEEIHQNNENSEDREEDDENGTAYKEGEMDGNHMKAEGEMGRKKFQRPGGRCKEDESGTGEQKKTKNIGLLNWEPLWVATS
ncbi:hypothetical protein ACOSQ3_007772 [Xanthoceras sorbifolium]